VTGNSFNVKAYPNQNMITVTVEKGSVQLFFKNDTTKKIILKAGECGSFSLESLSLVKTLIKDHNYAAWESGVFSFTETRLSDAIELIQQLYNVKFRFQNPNLGNCKISASFNNQSLDDILKMLEISFDMRIIKSDPIILIGESCK
jgi:transmembrane sensor